MLSNLTSKELIKKIKISHDTLKHWRYGYYISPDKYRIYYRDDNKGVPGTIVAGKSFDHYEYDLKEVLEWVASWRKSSIKNSILKKISKVFEAENRKV